MRQTFLDQSSLNIRDPDFFVKNLIMNRDKSSSNNEAILNKVRVAYLFARFCRIMIMYVYYSILVKEWLYNGNWQRHISVVEFQLIRNIAILNKLRYAYLLPGSVELRSCIYYSMLVRMTIQWNLTMSHFSSGISTDRLTNQWSRGNWDQSTDQLERS